MIRRFALTATLLFFLAACSDEDSPTGLPPTDSVPTSPGTLVKIAGDGQTGLAQSALADSLVVRAASGAWVRFNTTSGALSADSVRAGDDALARVQLTLGSGAATITALSAQSSVSFSASAAAPASLVLNNLASAGDLNEGAIDYGRSLPWRADLRAVMFFVDFSDAPASESSADLYQRIVPPGKAWLQSASYGRAGIDVVMFPKWYRMPKTAVSYDYNNNLTYLKYRAYLADAIAAADAEIDFSSYDIIYVVSASTTAIGTSPTFTYRAGQGIMADGVEHRQIVNFGRDARLANNYGAWIFTHETTHIFGLPDLYAYSNPSGVYHEIFRFAGSWDMMSWIASGGDLNGWHKYTLGWLDASQVKPLAAGGIEVVLSPVEVAGGTKFVFAPVSATKAYIIEVRQQTANSRDLCDKGVLIYTVDASIPNGQGPVRVVSPNPGSSSVLINRCTLLYDAPYDVGTSEVSHFEDTSGHLNVDVIAAASGGYRVRVKR